LEEPFYPDKQKTTALAVDECAIVWSGCRPTWASFRDHGQARGAPSFLSYLFHRFSKFKKGLSFLTHVRLINICEKDRFRIAEGNTLRISVTVITFDRHSVSRIKERMTKRACNDASSASNAKIFIDGDPVIIFRFPMAGLGRADLNAEGFFTVIASHGKIDPHMLPF
jgi:hypothetical protein